MTSKKEYTFNVSWDDEAKVWIAQNDEIPLVLEDRRIEDIYIRVEEAVEELVELNNLPKEYEIVLAIEDADKM